MTSISPLQMRRIARDLMNDQLDGRQNRASRNDGQILARMVQSGTASRAALDAAIDEIEKSALPLSDKKEALRVLERFKADTATGFGAELFSVDESFLRSLSHHGIDDGDKLLAAGSTTAKREVLAQKVGSTEKEIRRLVKQSDLMRADGIDGKLAHVLLASGVDSIPELAGRNTDNLHAKLTDFAKSQEGYVMSFKAPSKTELDAMVAAAAGLPRAVEFGTAESSFGSLSLDERIDLMVNQGAPLSTRDYDGKLLKLLNELGVPNAPAAIAEMRDAAKNEVRWELENWDIDIPDSVFDSINDYDALVEWVAENIGEDEADNMGNGWATWKDPEIEIFKNGREVVGARINFSRVLNGDHDYWTEYFVDAKAGRVVAEQTGGYEVDSDLSEVGAGSALSGSATSKRVEDLNATGLSSVKVNNRDISAWASDFNGATLDVASFKAARWFDDDDQVNMRPFGDSSDAFLASLKQGQSTSDSKKIDDAITWMRANLTNLSVFTSTGNTQLAGLDSDGALFTLWASNG